jgi:hypothetical protein
MTRALQCEAKRHDIEDPDLIKTMIETTREEEEERPGASRLRWIKGGRGACEVNMQAC